MFEFSSIATYQSQLQEGSVSCVQAVHHYLNAIRTSLHLNAYIEVYEEEALQRAASLDKQRAAGQPAGILHGVVIGIKDVICYKDHRVTASSKILEGFSSVYSATAIDRLLEAGAIIIGNLNCDEFAMGSTNENSSYGRVKNAADESRVSGGSSGGSAVAVQAGLCMISLGSDTGGSVRQPADFCGVVGLKPSYGRISRYGLIAYASSFDQIGIFALGVEDAALTLEVIAGTDDFDSTVSSLPVPSYSKELSHLAPTKYRIAYFQEALDHSAIDPEISQAIKEKIAGLKAAGHRVEAVPFRLLDFVVPAYYVLTTAEASSNLSRFDGIKYGYRAPLPEGSDLDTLYKTTRSQGFGPEVKRRIMLGTFVLSAGYYDAYFTQAQKVRKMLYQQTELIFNEFDFILSPNSPSVAFRAGEKTADPIEMYLADIYTVMANLVGIPGISLPLFQHSSGMPFGLQVMANRFEEVSLLRFSNLLMQA